MGIGTNRTACLLTAAAIASAAISGCAELEAYSRRVARNACRSAGTCTVYSEDGVQEVPCWPTQEGTMAYPGEAGWPFEPGVCDTVEEMNGDAPATASAK